ncbi:MAG: C25 family cysteine peptidase [bacterium]
MKRAVLALALLATALVAQTGARYLIITADLLEPSVRPLAEWKQARGLLTKVVKLSEIGTDTTSIRNFIVTAYNTWNPRPEFVLLVGSPNLNAGAAGALPAGRYRYGGGGGYSIYSDDRYRDVNNDGLSELTIGRFPAKTAAQCDVMVAKTLAYTQSPDVSDTLWTRRMTAVIRDYQDDDAPTYWADARAAATLARQNGFVACDSLASARGHTATHVVNSVNAGTNLVLYRGTATNNWYTPFAVNVASTTNGKRLPIILSFTCETMSLVPGESMVGDAWLKAGATSALKGAVAFVGTTASATDIARFRSAGVNGFFTGLFAERRYKLGLAFDRAKQNIYQLYPTYTSRYHEINLLGDPELDIWTDTPRAILVAHPSSITPEPQNVQVTVTRSGAPVQGADVCLSMDSTVYSVGVTDADGQVNLAVAPGHTGALRIVVTGHNLFPYDNVIPVELTGIDEAGTFPVPARRLVVTPSTFVNHAAIGWSAPLRADARLRIFDAIGRTVVELPAGAGSTSVTWHAAAAPAGVYRCLLVDRSGALIGSTRAVKAR